jgi:hypothetical protein
MEQWNTCQGDGQQTLAFFLFVLGLRCTGGTTS